MRLPHKTKDVAAQKNFDFLSARFGSYKLTDIRKATHSMAVGVSSFTIDSSSVQTVSGIIVVSLSPVAHWTWTWVPRAAFKDIVFNNTGALQNVDISYIVVGT
jgi:hypothetical protein